MEPAISKTTHPGATDSHLMGSPSGSRRSVGKSKAGERQKRRVIFASVSGTIIEWYDFSLYAVAAALIFAPQYFPDAGALGSVLAAFGSFAIGFIVRPLGGLLFAHFGDRLGRKPVMMATVLVMGLSTTLIGFLPNADAIGIWAPILLVTLRVLQGAGVGAEYAGAITMLNESVGDDQRTFTNAWAPAANYVGTTLATLFFALLTLMPSESFDRWGWRIPFIVTIVAVAVAAYMRSKVEETEDFQKVEQQDDIVKVPLLASIKRSPRQILCAAAIFSFTIPWSYVIQTYGLNYATETLGLERGTVLTGLVLSYVIMVPSMFVFGALADRIGVKPVLLIGTIGGFLFAFPLFLAVNTASPVLITLAFMVGLILSQGAPNAAAGALISRGLEARYRWSGITLARETPAAVMGGTAPLIATALVGFSGDVWLVPLYLMALSILGIIGTLAMPGSLYKSLDPKSRQTQ